MIPLYSRIPFSVTKSATYKRLRILFKSEQIFVLDSDRGSESGSFQAEHLINTFFGENLNSQPFEWNEPEKTMCEHDWMSL